LQKGFPIPNFESVVQKVIYGKQKWIEVDENLPVAEQKYIRHQNDLFLIKIAVQAPGCIFVCAEKSKQTLEDFRHPEISKHNIRSLGIEEALEFAQET